LDHYSYGYKFKISTFVETNILVPSELLNFFSIYIILSTMTCLLYLFTGIAEFDIIMHYISEQDQLQGFPNNG